MDTLGEWHKGQLRISEFKLEVMKLSNRMGKGLTRHEYRIALSELLNRDLCNTYRPKKEKKEAL